MRFPRLNNSEDGFTLVEILVTILVFTILLVALSRQAGWNFLSVNLVREKNQAVAIAQTRANQVSEWISGGKVNPEPEGYLSPEEFQTLSEDDAEDFLAYYTVEQSEQIIDGDHITGDLVSVIVFYNNVKSNVEMEIFRK